MTLEAKRGVAAAPQSLALQALIFLSAQVVSFDPETGKVVVKGGDGRNVTLFQADGLI